MSRGWMLYDETVGCSWGRRCGWYDVLSPGHRRSGWFVFECIFLTSEHMLTGNGKREGTDNGELIAPSVTYQKKKWNGAKVMVSLWTLVWVAVRAGKEVCKYFGSGIEVQTHQMFHYYENLVLSYYSVSCSCYWMFSVLWFVLWCGHVGGGGGEACCATLKSSAIGQVQSEFGNSQSTSGLNSSLINR